MERYRDSMSESALQDAIVAAARRLNYLVYHCRDSRTNEPGFPDLLIVGHGQLLVLELKTAKGRLRGPRIGKSGRVLPGQDDWLEAFAVAGVDALVVRPKDLDSTLALLKEGATT